MNKFSTTKISFYPQIVLLALVILFVVFPKSTFSQSYKAYNDSVNLHFDFINAASNGDIEMVNAAIKKGVNINHKDADWGTALFYAVGAERAEVVKTLLFYGANPNIGNYDGITPLLLASQFSFQMAELLLLKPETKLNMSDDLNITALHYASFYGQIGIVDMLLFYGAAINVKDEYSNNVINYGIYSGDTALVNILLSAGLNPFEENGFDLSALSLVIEYNDTLMFDMFAEHRLFSAYVSSNGERLRSLAIEYGNSYALQRIIAADISSIKTSSTEYEAAYTFHNVEAVDILSENNFQKPYLPIPVAAMVSLAHSFNLDDYTTFMGVGIKESRYKLSFSMNFGTRFRYKSFMEQLNESTFYQHWERRNSFSIQLRKDFTFLYTNKLSLGAYVASDLQWHWVDYRGRTRQYKGIAYLVPEIGLSISSQYVMFNIAYQYADYKLYHTSPHRIKIGVSACINLHPRTEKYSPL